MPRNTLAAKRYAEALFHLNDGAEGGSSKVLGELSALAASFEKDRGIEEFFLSPVVSKEDKRQVISEAKEIFPLTQRFLLTLIDANRMDCLLEIVSEFRARCEELAGELSVNVETAHPLSGDALEEIRAFLQDKWKRTIKMQTSINPEIIGGFIARSSGRVLDVSAASQLENLKQSILEA